MVQEVKNCHFEQSVILRSGVKDKILRDGFIVMPGLIIMQSNGMKNQ